MTSPSFEMPWPYMMSNSTSRNGGATLFLTTLTRTLLPTISSRCLNEPMRRVSGATGGEEFQGVAAGRRLRAAVHDADLHADLVDEDDQRAGLGDRGGQLAQRLAHQSRL